MPVVAVSATLLRSNNACTYIIGAQLHRLAASFNHRHGASTMDTELWKGPLRDLDVSEHLVVLPLLFLPALLGGEYIR